MALGYNSFMKPESLPAHKMTNRLAIEIVYLNFKITVLDEFLYRSRFKNSNEYRLGQVYFNMLQSKYPDVARALQGTIYDPFYENKITHMVDDRVLELLLRLPEYRNIEVV